MLHNSQALLSMDTLISSSTTNEKKIRRQLTLISCLCFYMHNAYNWCNVFVFFSWHFKREKACLAGSMMFRMILQTRWRPTLKKFFQRLYSGTEILRFIMQPKQRFKLITLFSNFRIKKHAHLKWDIDTILEKKFQMLFFNF